MASRIEQALLNKNGGNQSELARYVGVSPQAVQKWIAGLSEPKGKNLTKASEFLGVSPAYLKFGSPQGALQPVEKRPKSELLKPVEEVEPGPEIIGRVRNLPVVGQVQAGPDGLLVIDDYPVGFGDGSVQYWATCENAYALRVRGESMSPRYLPGEFVAVDPCSEVQPSQEVIVLKKDGTRMIKRLLWMRDGQACFESINKDYKNITLYMDEIDALHRVLGRVPPEAFRSSH